MPSRAFLTNKSERTFLNVLDSAIELFQDRGFQATSMRDISRASGLALGALYYYCRSKEDLIFQFYERVNDQIAASYDRRETKARTLADSFAEFTRLKMAKLSKYRKLLVVVLKESFDPDSVLSPLSKESSEFRRKNVHVFKQMVLHYDGLSADVDDNSRLLWMLHMALLAFWLYDRSDKYASTEALLNAIVAFLSWSAALHHLPGFTQIVRQLKGPLLKMVD